MPTASSDKPVTEASVTEEEEKGEEPETGLVESPPFTPLDYRIPDELFKKAKQAAKDTPESFWTYSLYRRQIEDSDHGAKSEGAGSPAEVKDGDRGSKVKIHYCMSRHTTERVCQYFLNEKLLGFDMEWMPWATKNHGPKENVSLVQISSQSRIALFHVALFQGKDPAELVAPTLRRILEDPDIKKAGVNIKGDCTRLRNNLGIEARGVFELSHLFRLVKYSASGETHLISKKLVNMAAQVEEHLGLAMFKGQDARLSNWMRQLSMQQIICRLPRSRPTL